MTVFRRELPLSRVVGPAAEAACHIEPTRVPPDRAEVVRRAGLSSLIFIRCGVAFSLGPHTGIWVEERPDKADELTGTGGHSHVTMFSTTDEAPEDEILTTHRAIGMCDDLWGLMSSPGSERGAYPEWAVAVLCGFHQGASHVPVAGLGDAASPRLAARVFTRCKAEVTHQFPGGSETMKIEELCDDGDCRDRVDTPQTPQPTDRLTVRFVRRHLLQYTRELLLSLDLMLNLLVEISEDVLVDRVLECERVEPFHVLLCPVCTAVGEVTTDQELAQSLPGPTEVRGRCVTLPHEIAYRLLLLRRRRHLGEQVGTKILRKLDRVPPVCLHAVARLDGDERWGHHFAHQGPRLLEQTLQCPAAGPGLITHPELPTGRELQQLTPQPLDLRPRVLGAPFSKRFIWVQHCDIDERFVSIHAHPRDTFVHDRLLRMRHCRLRAVTLGEKFKYGALRGDLPYCEGSRSFHTV